MISEDKLHSKDYPIALNAAFKIKLALLAFAFIPIATAMIGISIASLSVMLGGLTFAILAIPLWIYLIRRLRSQKLRLGKDGIRFVRVFGRKEIHIPWESIIKFHISPGNFGVVTDHPMDCPVSRQLARSNRMQLSKASERPDDPSVIMAQQRWVPFGSFVDWFWHGDLLTRLREFSPSLAQESEWQIGRYPEIRTGRGRWIMAFSVFAILFVAIFGTLWIIAQLLSVPGQTVDPLTIIIGRLASLTFALFLVLLVPTLGYYAVLSGISASQSLKDHDTGEAFFSLILMMAQAGFAVWIAVGLVNGNSNRRSNSGPESNPNMPSQTTVAPGK
jgi:hypothetical protein